MSSSSDVAMQDVTDAAAAVATAMIVMPGNGAPAAAASSSSQSVVESRKRQTRDDAVLELNAQRAGASRPVIWQYTRHDYGHHALRVSHFDRRNPDTVEIMSGIRERLQEITNTLIDEDESAANKRRGVANESASAPSSSVTNEETRRKFTRWELMENQLGSSVRREYISTAGFVVNSVHTASRDTLDPEKAYLFNANLLSRNGNELDPVQYGFDATAAVNKVDDASRIKPFLAGQPNTCMAKTVRGRVDALMPIFIPGLASEIKSTRAPVAMLIDMPVIHVVVADADVRATLGPNRTRAFGPFCFSRNIQIIVHPFDKFMPSDTVTAESIEASLRRMQSDDPLEGGSPDIFHIFYGPDGKLLSASGQSVHSERLVKHNMRTVYRLEQSLYVGSRFQSVRAHLQSQALVVDSGRPRDVPSGAAAASSSSIASMLGHVRVNPLQAARFLTTYSINRISVAIRAWNARRQPVTQAHMRRL